MAGIKQFYIGTLGHLQVAPMPKDGMTVDNAGYTEMMAFENGGAAGVRSAQFRKRYKVSFSGIASDLNGIEYYGRLRSGFHGTGLIYFNNPFDYKTNLLAAGWASPGLGKLGWKTIGDPELVSGVSYTDSLPNAYNQPFTGATFGITAAVGAVPKQQRYRHVVVIPPERTLWFGASGSTTGTGRVYVRPILKGEGVAYDTPVAIAPVNPQSAARLTNSFSGATYKAVEIYLGRASTAASVLTLTSMMAQLWPNGSAPTLTGPHIEGHGHTGCMFADDAVTENYLYFYPPRKGISTVLEEVGAWQR